MAGMSAVGKFVGSAGAVDVACATAVAVGEGVADDVATGAADSGVQAVRPIPTHRATARPARRHAVGCLVNRNSSGGSSLRSRRARPGLMPAGTLLF